MIFVPELCLGRFYVKAFFKAEGYEFGMELSDEGICFLFFSTFEHAYVKL